MFGILQLHLVHFTRASTTEKNVHFNLSKMFESNCNKNDLPTAESWMGMREGIAFARRI